MQKSLCNSSVDGQCAKHGSMHICSMDHGHKGQTHICGCGTIFLDVKKSELDKLKPLEKVQ